MVQPETNSGFWERLVLQNAMYYVDANYYGILKGVGVVDGRAVGDKRMELLRIGEKYQWVVAEIERMEAEIVGLRKKARKKIVPATIPLQSLVKKVVGNRQAMYLPGSAEGLGGLGGEEEELVYRLNFSEREIEVGLGNGCGGGSGGSDDKLEVLSTSWIKDVESKLVKDLLG
ncbi:hypothetical protein NEHOM01_1358 [Nematocida homosporus]|uniref:uncharacterized protein n=1 Tax=Nematocida homosporus TaxID=1912981 RepID=UPI0022207499|nr:uncharacterized protein NEHOM01_1358 [Nematocida homosporus]KAI5186269.1 hypothetical protein NEHOM01_1358 [Nematocida homosporus]